MLQWFRASARVLAAALLVSLATLGASSVVPHADDCHTEFCGFDAVPHDPSQHSLDDASSGDEHPLHCVVCHWTRLHRPSIDVVHQFAPASAPHPRVLTDAVAGPLVFAAAQPPLRSPPDTPASPV